MSSVKGAVCAGSRRGLGGGSGSSQDPCQAASPAGPLRLSSAGLFCAWVAVPGIAVAGATVNVVATIAYVALAASATGSLVGYEYYFRRALVGRRVSLPAAMRDPSCRVP